MSEYNETSHKIMNVALKLFSEQGYYSTTTKQIAQEAGVNELTIFRHFGSKANLFQVTTEEYVIEAHVEDILLDGVDNLSFEEVMIILVKRINELYKQNKKLYKVQLKLADNEGDFVKLKLSRKIKEILEEYFDGQRKKDIISGDPRIMAVTLINGLLGAFTVDILSDNNFSELSEEEKINEFAKLFIALYKNN